jgi:hypothetical protein
VEEVSGRGNIGMGHRPWASCPVARGPAPALTGSAACWARENSCGIGLRWRIGCRFAAGQRARSANGGLPKRLSASPRAEAEQRAASS